MTDSTRLPDHKTIGQVTVTDSRHAADAVRRGYAVDIEETGEFQTFNRWHIRLGPFFRGVWAILSYRWRTPESGNQ